MSACLSPPTIVPDTCVRVAASIAEKQDIVNQIVQLVNPEPT